MTDREKMIDLIINAKKSDPETGSFTEYLADFLLGYGIKLPDPTPQPGKPLTLDQLREMDGKPAWCEDVERWALISVSDVGKWEGVPFALFVRDGGRFEWDIEDHGLCMHPYPLAQQRWIKEANTPPTNGDRIRSMPTLTPPNEWVSVEERLPEKHSEYIVCACDEGEPIDERIWGDTVVVCADYYDGAFTWYEGNTEYDISDIVTHWMPLPEPPEER